jgi:hypothetical protein
MECDTVGARFGFAAIIVSSERLIRLSQGLAKRSERGDLHFTYTTAFDIVPVCD